MGLLDDKWFKPNSRNLEAKANRLLKRKKTRRGSRGGKKRPIPKMSYKQYMGSAYWRARKNRYFSKHGKACAVCGKKAGTTLHHTKYNDVYFGNEPDEILIPLCGKHHHEYHANMGVTADMRKLSAEYVRTAKQLHESNLDDLSWVR